MLKKDNPIFLQNINMIARQLFLLFKKSTTFWDNPGLCAMNKTGWYITRFCMLLTIMVGISPNFFCRGQSWLVYQPVLSVVDKKSWYINRFCRSWTILGGIFHGCVLLGQYWLVNQPVLSFMDSNGWLSPCFVCRGQYWLVYLPMLYVMNKNGWYITRFCLLWTVMVGISPRVFCRGQNWLVYQTD